VVEETIEDIARDIEELRALISELRPATLDQLGLVAALGDLAERVEHGAKIEFDAELEVDEGRLDPELETVVYRLVQEALNNVAKHAGAGRVELQVRSGEDRLAVLISDDGKGFDIEGEFSGFGLAGMRERVELAGGELQIESRPGSGTRVSASMPIEAGGGSGLDEAAGERAAN
jgi:signal transduction histidine kinase